MFFFCANSLRELSTSKSIFASSTNKENEISELTLFRIGSFVKPIIKIEKISNLFTNKLDNSKFQVLLLNDSHSMSFGVVKEETLSRIITNYYSETIVRSIEDNHVIMILEYELIRRSNQMLRDDEISYFMNSIKADNLNSDLSLISLESFIIIGKDTTCSIGQYDRSFSSSTCQYENEEEEDDDEEEIDEEKALAMLSSASTSSQHQQKHNLHHHHESSEQSSSILSIYSLSPSLSNQIWTIKSCLSKISPVKEFPYKKGDVIGRVMRMQFYDRTGYIEVVFFNEFIDRYKDFFEIGKFYLIRNSEIKYSKKTYRAWPEDLYSNFDLIVTKTTEFQLTDNEIIHKSEIAAPSSNRFEQQKMHTLNSQQSFATSQTTPNSQKHASSKEQQSDNIKSTFISLDQLILKKNKSLVDVIGVVCDIGDMSSLKLSKKKPLYIKRIKIVDNTADPISVAFWGEQASNLNVEIGQIYMFKGAELSSYGGLSLSVLRSTGFMNITGYYNVSGVEKLSMWWRRIKTKYSTPLDNVDNDAKELVDKNGKGLKRARDQDDNEEEDNNDESCEPKDNSNNKKLFKRG